jgi:DNA-binding MarR family transcriptional regulator
MSDNAFFKPTVLYKEFLILDLIEKDHNITQRQMAEALGVAVSMVNQYLDEYEQKGYIKRKYISTKTVEYFVSKKGTERRKLLNIWYLKSSNDVYIQAKANIITFLNQVIDKGFKKILLYGAGEVAELMLQVMNDDKKIPLEVLAVIDDSEDRTGHLLVNLPIIHVSQLDQFVCDGILISSYKHHETIHNNLLKINYPKEKIIHFFDN